MNYMMNFNKFVDIYGYDSGLYFHDSTINTMTILFSFLFEKEVKSLNIVINTDILDDAIQQSVVLLEKNHRSLNKYIPTNLKNINKIYCILSTLIFFYYKKKPKTLLDFKKSIQSDVVLINKIKNSVEKKLANTRLLSLLQ